MAEVSTCGTDQAPPGTGRSGGSDSGDSAAAGMLLEFVRDRDIECPRCGYNLRNLTRPACPECDEPLLLKVGVQKVRVFWLLATLAPGFFSGIAGGLMVVATILYGPPPLETTIVMIFGLVSGVITLVVAAASRRFMRLPTVYQVVCAAFTWTIHTAAFIALLLTV
jgi:hypothetical protein